MELSEITRPKSSSTILDTLSAGAGRLGRSLGESAGHAGKAIGSGLSQAKNFLGRNMEAGLNQQVKAFDPKIMALLGGGLGALGGAGVGAIAGGKGRRMRTALLGALAGAGVGGLGGAFAGQEMGRAAQRNVPDDIQRNSYDGGTTPHMRRDAKISIKDLPAIFKNTFGGGAPGAQRGAMNRTIRENNPGIYDAHRNKGASVPPAVLNLLTGIRR